MLTPRAPSARYNRPCAPSTKTCSCRRGLAVGQSKPVARSTSAAAEATSEQNTHRHSDLREAADKLLQMKTSGASKENIEQQIEALTQLSVASGTNTITPELNNGNFAAYTLTGQTAQRFNTVMTLGTMSFNKYKPVDVKVKMSMSGEIPRGGVYKGPKGPIKQAYIVTAHFDFVKEETEEDAAEPIPLTGLKGRHLAIAEYSTVPDNPQRLIIHFNRVQLEPDTHCPDHLKQWLDTLLPHNPEMDPITGVLNVEMAQQSPEAWLDNLMMIPEYQLLKGSFGSVTLLKRLD